MDARRQARVAGMLDALEGALTVAREVPDTMWDAPTGCPGWSVKGVLSHVTGLEAIMTGDPEPVVEVPEGLRHADNAVSRYTERHVLARASLPAQTIIDEFERVVERRHRQLEGDLDAATPSFMGGEQPLIQSLGLRTFDIYAHEQDIRRAIDRPGHLTGPAAEIALTRMLRGINAQLPDRLDDVMGTLELRVVGAQEGVTVFDLHTGDVLDGSTLHATVRLTLDFADLIPLACGRDDAPDPGRVAKVEGDAALAAQILTALTITP